MAYQKQTAGAGSNNVFGAITVQGAATLASVAIGGGGSLTEFQRGTFVANTSAIAQFAAETVTFALSGATTADMVFVTASSLLDAGLTLVAAAQVTATSVVTVTFINHSSASVTQTSGLTSRYLHIALA